MALDLNMTAMSMDVFPTLVATAGPILECARAVSKDPSVRTLEVPVFTAVTAREYTQGDASHVTDAANNTKISVTTNELYHVMKMNQLQAGQTPVDLVRGYLPIIGSALGLKMLEKMNLLVTAAAYTNTAITSTAANFDADDMADAARDLSIAKAPKVGRYAMLSPAYTGALSKDNAIQAAYAFGDDGVIKRNEIPVVHGFRVHEVTDIVASGDVAALEGWFASPDAFAVAFSPAASALTGWAPTVAARGSYTDPSTGITIATKVWDDNLGNIYIGGYVGFGIARGNVGSLQILKSA
jgi:hypothetical protein